MHRPILLTAALALLTTRGPAQEAIDESRVIVPSDGWELVGDLTLPAAGRAPAVLMLNQAAGNRDAYRALARQLAARGIASLRLDLRGHGESVNLGAFVPGEVRRDPLIWDAEQDVTAALTWMRNLSAIDGTRIAVVGASYSGEEMAEAGRLGGYAAAYVALSPGSFEEVSIDGIDASGVPWLFVVSRDERFLQEITTEVRRRSDTVELVVVPGSAHASNLLEAHPGMAERIAVWLATVLEGG
jgi:dienelactone hydrolase